MSEHPHFIPHSRAGSRQETAVLLVGTAREFGIDQHDIKSVQGGFRISDALDKVLSEESKPAPKKTSGNRAAKNKPTEE